jgi:hypothetical protein
VDSPETHYAKAPDGTSIAYQVVGDGPIDLVYAIGIWSNVEVMWEHAPWSRFFERGPGTGHGHRDLSGLVVSPPETIRLNHFADCA